MGDEQGGFLHQPGQVHELVLQLAPDQRIQGAAGFIHQQDIRVSGARAALRDAGLDASQVSHHVMPLAISNACRASRDIATQADDRPTALLCLSDVLALGALLELPRHGIRVPADISVIGFDDLEWADCANPPLTTIHLPTRSMGQAIAMAILDALDSGVPVKPRLLEAELVLRNSTAPPPQSGTAI
ncbi:substrate-binding domain-containing protein [Marinobacterium rhizophilum]|uniref:Substrate-binding domain-containing protein n=1 Tax=Marinobacterium rhizophilum TaxID=420402 RepID=A0ABY5HG17_9GAMM|nr:substrate-binding domain-containing protein [Marinobacterium rhizophilum]UTW10249.1 substrate-binding domain-containing protein [Marinobacterium rhizophilum]